MVIKIRLFGVIEEMRKRGQTEIVSKQINQPNKSLRCSKSRKLINYPSPANSIILPPLFVIKNILNNIFGSLYFTQPWPYHVFYFLSCHFHKLHRYIYIYFYLSGAVHMVWMFISRFGVPCFTIPGFAILPNKTVL